MKVLFSRFVENVFLRFKINSQFLEHVYLLSNSIIGAHMLASKNDVSALDRFLTVMFLHGLITHDEVSDIQKELQNIIPKNIKEITNEETVITLETIERIFEKNYGHLFLQKEKKLFQDFFSIEKKDSQDWHITIKNLSVNCKLCNIFSDDTYLAILNMLETKTANKIPIPENSASTRYRKIKLLHTYGLITENVLLESQHSIIKKTVFLSTFDQINISINSKTLSNLHFDPNRTKSEIIERFLLNN